LFGGFAEEPDQPGGKSDNLAGRRHVYIRKAEPPSNWKDRFTSSFLDLDGLQPVPLSNAERINQEGLSVLKIRPTRIERLYPEAQQRLQRSDCKTNSV